jgi:2-methylcitrate dehydratase PrpD
MPSKAPSSATPGLQRARGVEWAIADGYTKINACCQQTHSAVEAVLSLALERSEQSLNSIEEIVVETHPFGMPLQNYAPPTTLASKFSLPHVVATAFVHGHAGAEAFAAATLTDPGISRLRNKVRVTPYLPLPAAPNDRPARIRVRLTGGKQMSAQCLSAQGGPDRPFPRETLVAKIRELTASVYPSLLPTLMQIATLDPQCLQRTWSDTVTEICGAA